MVSFYEINNKDKNTKTVIDEITFIQVLSILKIRNNYLYNKFKVIWEELEEQKFNEELFKK